MVCPECGARLPRTVSPGTGGPVSPGDAAVAGPATAPPTPAPVAFRFDATRWTPADRVTGAGAAIVSFVPVAASVIRARQGRTS